MSSRVSRARRARPHQTPCRSTAIREASTSTAQSAAQDALLGSESGQRLQRDIERVIADEMAATVAAQQSQPTLAAAPELYL